MIRPEREHLEQQFAEYQLRALHRIARILASPGEPADELGEALRILSDELGMRRGIISILTGTLDELRVIVSHDIQTEAQTVSYRLGEGITGRVVATGKPIAVPSLDQEPLFLDRTGARRHLDISTLSFLCVPIIYDGTALGALSVDIVKDSSDNLEVQLALLENAAALIAGRIQRRILFEESSRLRGILADSPLRRILGESEPVRELRHHIRTLATSSTTVLITGETGTGKGLVAETIHLESVRRDKPFIKVNCSAISPSLIESELFGHRKGAFTGATENRTGHFETANGGSIFLDEIGDMPIPAQAKLLTVIQEREFTPVGDSRPRRVDVRIIAATNHDLETAVAKGRFRADLFYRLNVFRLHVPPLRERGSDILVLAKRFLDGFVRDSGRQALILGAVAADALMRHAWPGNVRELANTMERAAIVATGDTIRRTDLPPEIAGLSVDVPSAVVSGGAELTLEERVAQFERALIVQALEETEGNQSRAARRLGTTKRIMQYKCQKYGIDYRAFRDEGTPAAP